MNQGQSELKRVPLISVVLPALNAKRWIAEALESLRNQTFQDFEVLLIDDGSTDDTVAIAHGAGLESLRVMQGPRRGVGAARALGVASSSSMFIATQDADDISHPQRFEKQIAFMLSHPNCVVLGSKARLVDEQGGVVGIINVPEKNRSAAFTLNLKSPFVHTSVLMRRQAILRAGNYRAGPTKIFAEDYDLWTRIAQFGDLHNIQEPLVSYRINSISATGAYRQAALETGFSIAIRTTEVTLGKRLCKSDREIFSLFYRRHRRFRVSEVFRFYKLLVRLFISFGFPPPWREMTRRSWIAPAVLTVRAPRPLTSQSDEILKVP